MALVLVFSQELLRKIIIFLIFLLKKEWGFKLNQQFAILMKNTIKILFNLFLNVGKNNVMEILLILLEDLEVGLEIA
jgi:hypothetical protein